MSLSTHATKRVQQRAIPKNVIDLLLQYGQRSYDHHHGAIYTFDRRSKKRLKTYLGNRLADFFIATFGDCYVVADAESDHVITAGINTSKKLH